MKTNYPDSLTIQQYLNGKLDPEVAHQLEKQALDDPFLWDALEGYSTYRDPAGDLSIMQRQLHERIVHMQENKKVFDLSWQRLSVAATAAVMFVSAGILFWMNSHKPQERLASQSQKPVEVNVIDRDSVEAVIKAKDEPVTASLQKHEEVLDDQSRSKTKTISPETRKANISPKAEGALSAQEEVAPISELTARTMASASAPAVARSGKLAVIEPAGTEKKRAVQNNESLNEVVVNVYRPQPKVGWKSYQEYLAANAKKFITDPALKGSVLLSFKIELNGKISDIKVVRSLNEAYNKEAMRIIKDGPEWMPSPNGQTIEQRISIDFEP